MNISDLIVKEIVSVYTVDLNIDTYSNTNRPYSAFCLKTSGYSTYTQSGVDYYSDATHLILVPVGSTYRYSVKAKGTCVIIEFVAENLPKTITSFEINEESTLKTITSNMEYAWTFKRIGYREICLSQIYKLLYLIVYHQGNPYTPKVHKMKIEKSMLYLLDHFCDHNLTIGDLAQQSGISEMYFRKVFNEIYGMPPKRYIIMMRINRAKELLNISELTICQIADIVGFGDIYSFSKTFKSEVGSTPTEYSKAIHHKESAGGTDETEP